MRRLLIIAVAIGLPTAIVVFAFVANFLFAKFDAPGPLTEDKIVVVPRGAGLAAIAEQLERDGVIADSLLFRLGVRYEGRQRALKAGEYSFAAGISMRGAMDLMESGDTVVRRVTFPEGMTSTELIALLNAAEGLNGEIVEVPPEGALLPETYHFSLDDSREDLLQRMIEARTEVLTELWNTRAEGLPLATPEEALILASIVEEETGLPEERPLVAGVFVNRLRKGMPLQSDPTVAYGITNGKTELGRALTRKDLKTPSAYNTYTIRGLPPGPIANPGRASIEAVLQPVATEYLYFVADGTGGHAFAKTLAEHNRNVAKWRKVQRQKRQTE